MANEHGRQTLENAKGETSATFQLTVSARRAHNGVRVRAWASVDGRGTAFSKTATIWVESAIEFSKQPENQVVAAGGTARFATEIFRRTGSRPDFQWQFSPLGSGLWLDLADENEAVLALPSPKPEQSGTAFRLRASTAGGCDTVFSRPAFLEILEKPVVFVTPGTHTFCGGGNATFSVKMAGGSSRERIQWQRSRDAGRHFADIAGATDLFYMVLKITEEMNDWRFRAMVTLPGGQTWAHQTGSFGQKRLAVKWLPSTASNRLFRMKVLSRECGRIYFLEAARAAFEN